MLARIGAVIWDVFLGLVCRHYLVSGEVVLRNLTLTGTETVLDLGGGTGGVARRLRGSARHIVVVEPVASLIRRGRGRSPGVRFVRARGEAVPLRDRSVDAVLLIEVLHHVPDERAVLAEAARVLRPGGRMLIEESEFGGSIGKVIGLWAERLISRVWPRTREGIRAALAELELEATPLEHEGFVIMARAPDPALVSAGT